MVVGESHNSVGKRYCRKCESYFMTMRLFWECCSMQLRVTPSEREYKEKMRENLITVNKSSFKKRQNCETKSLQSGKHFMPGTNL
jgi:hypothetical protein